MTTAPIPQIRLYQEWLARTTGRQFADYASLWQWSVSDLDGYWQSVWDYFDLRSPTPHTRVCDHAPMPATRWFVGAQCNYAHQVLRHVAPAHAAGFPAIVAHDEASLGVAPPRTMTWPQLRQQVAALALYLQSLGVEPGDRVAAYLPNVPETMVAFLATISVGAVWSVCSPDMGTQAVLDRFTQIAPRVLIACDGIRYGGRAQDRSTVVAELVRALPSVQQVIWHATPYAHAVPPAAAAPPRALLATLCQRDDAATDAFEPLWLPFDHPLWIVYSSGTTGLPKPIVHGHGGTVLVGLALKRLHNDIGCSYERNTWGERYHWYSSTGWVMWNAQVAGLLDGTTCCLYDGNPGGATHDDTGQRLEPDWSTLWRFAAELGVSFFGAGAAFYAQCLKAEVPLADLAGLASVRTLGTTGSPLGADAQNWVTEQLQAVRGPGAPALWWSNISGGTDFAGAFIGGHRELPLVSGQMQCRLLGCAVEAWNEAGQPVIDAVGELVCTQPIPSMPLYLWGDTDHQRYLSSYFDLYPGVWRHGDWLRILPSGACIIYGRSDTTINRHGLRMGSSEIYRAVEALPEVLDSLVVDLEYLGRPGYMPLFVVLRAGLALDAALRERIVQAIRTGLSPRFVPDAIVQVAEVPRTLSGKKQELPIKRLLLGHPIEKVINREAMANPGCLDWYLEFARAYRAQG